MSDFSPFGSKTVSDLVMDDLECLQGVREGWYVEYKREILSPKGLAKSISAFANTYGGWLFFGIAETRDSTSKSIEFSGIDSANVEVFIDQIRQAVASHLNPTPFFEVKRLDGPCQSIGLPKDKSVICIHIPQGLNAPFVHSSGVIYRRVGDGSEPVPEQDRHQLELLFSRRVKSDEAYQKWIDRVPEIPADELNRPYLRVMLDADPDGQRGHRWNLSPRQFKDELNKAESTYVIPFEAVHRSGVSIVARQTSSLLKYNGFALSFILLEGAKCELHIPLNYSVLDKPRYFIDTYPNYDYVADFCSRLESEPGALWRIVDLTHAFIIVLALARKFFVFLGGLNHDVTHVWCKVIASGIHYSVPFLDSKDFVRSVIDNGIPLCVANQVMVPSRSGRDGFAELPVDLINDNAGVGFATWLFEMICMCLSLEGLYSERTEEERAEMIRDLLNFENRPKTD